jgi:hypothetical protein
MLLSFLGPELARAKHRKSCLFMPTLDTETDQMIGDRTLDNLFIKGVWSEVTPHLRWALAGKRHVEPWFSFKIVNDEKLLRVYVGDFAYNKRSTKVRDDIETYNNLSDLISAPSLLIVRLGKLGWKNKAAAHVLLEALNIRASESKPTWLIEGEQPFGDGHPFFNSEVGHYIEQHFDIVDMGGDVKAAQETWAALLEMNADTAMGADIDALVPVFESKERFVAEPDALEDRGRAYNKKKKKWRGSSSNSGGGLPGAL